MPTAEEGRAPRLFTNAEAREELVEDPLVIDSPANPPERIERAAQVGGHQLIGRRLGQFGFSHGEALAGRSEISSVAGIDRHDISIKHKLLIINQI